MTMNDPDPGWHVFTIRVEDELYDKLVEEANREDRSLAGMLRAILRERYRG